MIYVIITIFPHGDAQVATASNKQQECIDDWIDYITHGEPLENASDNDRAWLVKACVDLLQYGITDKQDSGVFYRMHRAF